MDPLIISALKEDVNYIDVSSEAVYKENKKAKIDLKAKEDGILCGLPVFKRTFELLSPEVSFKDFKEEGEKVEKGDIVMVIEGDVLTLLTGERTALNFLCRMSGTATYTGRMIEALGDDNIKILDTRKTTPNMRVFEKYAVRVGGGFNHRFNLSDSVMLKDNHIQAAGGVKEAIRLAKDTDPFISKIEIEAENIEMVKEALEGGADIIMLDNMNTDTIIEAAEIIGDKAITEISGNVTLDNIGQYKGLPVDYISSGALTHSAGIIDFSMKNLRFQ